VLLAALRDAGLSDQEAIDAFDALASYVVGATLREVSRLANYAPPAERLRELRRLPEGEFPHVRSMATPFVARTVASGFDRGLELLIAGIARRTGDQS
jgi:hypothetical protein